MTQPGDGGVPNCLRGVGGEPGGALLALRRGNDPRKSGGAVVAARGRGGSHTSTLFVRL